MRCAFIEGGRVRLPVISIRIRVGFRCGGEAGVVWWRMRGRGSELPMHGRVDDEIDGG